MPPCFRAADCERVPPDQVNQPLVPASNVPLATMLVVVCGPLNASLSTFAPPPLKRTKTFRWPASGAHGIDTVFSVPQSPDGASGTVATGALARLSRWMVSVIGLEPPFAYGTESVFQLLSNTTLSSSNQEPSLA